MKEGKDVGRLGQKFKRMGGGTIVECTEWKSWGHLPRHKAD